MWIQPLVLSFINCFPAISGGKLLFALCFCGNVFQENICIIGLSFFNCYSFFLCSRAYIHWTATLRNLTVILYFWQLRYDLVNDMDMSWLFSVVRMEDISARWASSAGINKRRRKFGRHKWLQLSHRSVPLTREAVREIEAFGGKS